MKEIWKLFMVRVVKKPTIGRDGMVLIPKEDKQNNIIVCITTKGEILSPLPLTIEQEAWLKDFYKKNYQNENNSPQLSHLEK